MASPGERCNGFKIRGLNPDSQKVSVQSSTDSTWMLPYKRWAGMPPKWSEVGIARDELKVLRCNGSQPVIEIEPLGGPYGILVIQRSRGETRTLRVGQRWRMELGYDESVVIRTEFLQYPKQESSPGFAGMSV